MSKFAKTLDAYRDAQGQVESSQEDPNPGTPTSRTQSIPTQQPAPEPQGQFPVRLTRQRTSKKSKTPGKHRNPQYTLATAYVLKETHEEVMITLMRRRRLGHKQDFSELVQELLSTWLGQQQMGR